MGSRSSKRKGRPVPIPIMGDAEHNAAIQIVIGGLVVAWANNESVFQVVLRCLLNTDEKAAAVAWYHQRTSQGRLDLIMKLARLRITDDKLLNDLAEIVGQFGTLSRRRNFYCHAVYDHGDAREIQSATGVTLTQDGYPIRVEKKWLNRATMNEIGQTVLALNQLNLHVWSVAKRIGIALQVQHVEWPPQLDGSLDSETHLPKDEPLEP